MICLTGDLHHSSLRTGNQKASDISEMVAARRYLRMLEEAQIKVTFFVSGQSFYDDRQDLLPICESPWVEIGGHNMYCFKPALPHRIWKKLIGSYNGPFKVQLRDVIMTRSVIHTWTGKFIQCWRNHMYMHGPFTEEVLSCMQIRVCSDGVEAASMGPVRHPTGLWLFPLNVMPDHEHLYHAERTPAWVKWWQERYQWSDDFGPESYWAEDWTDRVLDNLEHNERRGAISCMIIHPITLYLADGFRSFQRIRDYLAKRHTVFMSEVIDYMEGR